jgi:RNA polymerase sigma-70 factor (ECF subfamily)
VIVTARVLRVEKEPDSKAFAALYAQHLRAVWRTLQRLGIHPAGLDDAVQEVFLTAWRRWADFEGRSSERTWLLGISIRVAADTRRKQRPTEGGSHALPVSAPGPESTAASREVSRRVNALLARLAPERREVLLLVDLEGYTVPEVAEATGVNLNTLYTRLRAARQEFEGLVQTEAEALR